MLLAAALLWACTVSHTVSQQVAQCPTQCSCSGGALVSLECGDVTVRARDDLYMEVECVDSAWQCSSLPRLQMFHGETLHRLEVSRCLLNSSDDAANASLKCALESLGATDAAALALVDTRGALTHAHVAGLTHTQALYLAAAPGAVSTIPISAIKALPSLRSVRLLSLSSPPLPAEMFRSSPPLPLERLELAMSALGRLPARAFYGLSRLRVLSLWKNDIREVDVDAFAGLESLQELILNNNPLPRLPPAALRSAPRLATLRLLRGGLEVLEEGAVSGMEHLTQVGELVLNNNLSSPPLRLRRALGGPEDGLYTAGTVALGELVLDKTVPAAGGLGVLEDEAVAGMEHLTQIQISNDIELKLSPFSLSNLPSLSDLQLSHSHISSLPPTLLDNTTNIVNMTLSNNNIPELPGQMFLHLTSLRRLDLSANEIATLSRDVFYNLRALEELNLDRNNIEVLPDRVFSGLTRLRSLSLSHNSLRHISPTSLAGAAALSSLRLGGNRLRWGAEGAEGGAGDFLVEPSSPLNMLTELKTLSLRGNQISAVFSDWRFVLLRLQSLDLSYNAFTQLSASDLQFLQSNIQVDFSHNNITTVSPYTRLYDTFDTSDTIDSSDTSVPSVSFILNNNPFDCSCTLYHFLTQAKLSDTYDISSAKCQQPTDMRNTLLKSVSLADITCPVDNVSDCSCLVRPEKMRVECDCTEPAGLPDPGLMGLDSLALRLTSATKLDLNLNLPEYVTELNISNLSLKEIPPIPKTIKLLDVSHNKLEKIPTQLLNRNLTLKLSRNPFTCDCWTTNDVILLKNNSKYILDYNEVTCLGNRKINILDPQSLCNVYNSAATGTLVALIGLLIGVLIAVLYRYRVEIQVYLYSRGVCLLLLPREEEDCDKLYDVFVSFAAEDEKFVCEEILPPLQGRYLLLVRDRDWLAGDTIPTQIRNSVERSRRTLIVLTDNFLNSIWATEELRTIHGHAANDKRTRAVVVTKVNKQIDKDTKTYLSLATNIKWGDRMFWEKLIYALPRKDGYGGGNTGGGRGSVKMGGEWRGDGLNVMLNEEGKLVNKGYDIKQ